MAHKDAVVDIFTGIATSFLIVDLVLLLALLGTGENVFPGHGTSMIGQLLYRGVIVVGCALRRGSW